MQFSTIAVIRSGDIRPRSYRFADIGFADTPFDTRGPLDTRRR